MPVSMAAIRRDQRIFSFFPSDGSDWFFAIFLNDSLRYAQIRFDPQLGTQIDLDKYNVDSSTTKLYTNMKNNLHKHRYLWKVQISHTIVPFNGIKTITRMHTVYFYCIVGILNELAIESSMNNDQRSSMNRIS